MMGKKYQLVAWTENISDKEKGRLHMLPSLEFEMRAPYFEQISRFQQEELRNHGKITVDLARRFIRIYEQNADFEFLTGHYGDGLRLLSVAALYCIWSEEVSCTYWDSDRGNYSYSCGELRYEFTRLSEKVITLAKKYRREDIFLEKQPSEMLKYYHG